jgi:hypothetical protein
MEPNSSVYPQWVTFGMEDSLAMAWDPESKRFVERNNPKNFYYGFRHLFYTIDPVDTRIIEFPDKPDSETIEDALTAWFNVQCVLETPVYDTIKGDVLLFSRRQSN